SVFTSIVSSLFFLLPCHLVTRNYFNGVQFSETKSIFVKQRTKTPSWQGDKGKRL
ncbi:unnamed protein product, partial [Prunus brigantina]